MNDTPPKGTLTLQSLSQPSKKVDLAVFIGRFSPLHDGHMSVINLAMERANHVLILVGSANEPRSHRNPFTTQERIDMIFGSVDAQKYQEKIYCEGIEDSDNDDSWVFSVQKAVNFVLDDIAENQGWSPLYDLEIREKMTVALIGYSKDHTSYYLSMFPGYSSIEAPNYKELSSTSIRERYFAGDSTLGFWDYDGFENPGCDDMPGFVCSELAYFSGTPEYRDIREEYEFIAKYKKQWEVAPFPVTMVTTDAVVVQSGHILLVRRGARPGRGLWALPGGYLNQNERIIDGTIRELIEETKIGVSADELKKLAVATRVFDNPHRDPRGRVITHATRFDLPLRRTLVPVTKKKIRLDKTKTLEPVTGASDADKAKWFPYASIKCEMMFSDHYRIIKHMMGLS